jgi:hypothetical protein
MSIRSFTAGILAGLVLGGVAWAGHESKPVIRWFITSGFYAGQVFSDRDSALTTFGASADTSYLIPRDAKLIEERCDQRTLLPHR